MIALRQKTWTPFAGARPATTLLRSALAALLSLAVAAPAAAQQAEPPQAQLQITQGPYYTGIPIDLQVLADNFEEQPVPEVRIEPPAGARLDFVHARPQVSSMMQILNGRVTQSRSVRYAFVYRLTAPTAGSYTLGPFTVEQDGRSAVTRTITIKVGEVPEAGGQKLRLVLPEGPIYIGQRVPLTVEWWTEAGLADRLFDEHLSVPLFFDTANFQFLDQDRGQSRLVLAVDVPGGRAEYPVDVRQQAEDGRQYVVRSFTRTLIPVASGRFSFAAPSLFSEEAVSFQRDIFGSRVPSRSRKLRVSGEPLELEVQPVPTEGRPASFSGAIGQGFSVSVSADRTVLQTGDPVKLSFTIQGDGTLDSAGLPPLAAAGLSEKQFRLPDGEVAGITDERGKHFDVTVRVLDPTVHEIPPIEYSWFDPAQGKFQTTRTQPIALSVRGATVVGAGDVVSATPASEPDEPQKKDKGGGGAESPSKKPVYTLTGADLSIETSVARLRAASPSLLGSPVVIYGSYAAGLAALVAGWLERRRRRRDPVQTKLRSELRALRKRIASARGAREAADALRRMAAALPERSQRPPRLDAVLASLDEASFAPGGGEAAIAGELRKDALGVADAILEQVG